MSIDSVGVSNTAGYSFTGGDPVSTGGIVGMGNGISSYTQMGGSRKGGSRKGGSRKGGSRKGGSRKGVSRRKGKKKGRQTKRKTKSKKRRPLSKRARLMSKLKVSSFKKSFKKATKKHHHKKRLKHRSARVDVIKSIESGLPIPDKSKKKLTPSMQEFIDGIETKTKSGSVIKFSDFKSEPLKSKKSKTSKKARTRGGSSRGSGKGGFLSFLF